VDDVAGGKMSFGVYVHFPYCRKRCPYCDFAVHVRQRIPHARYAEAILRELDGARGDFAGRRAVSIYFGGGTPGLWEAAEVARVIAGVRAAFPTEDPEITVEANPEDLPLQHLVHLREAGVNRLSIGVQSLVPRHLHALGRVHGAGEAERAVEDARAAGFENLSLDLMFALPAQTLTELEHDLAGVIALGPEHVSVYNLTVEERTPFGAMKRDGLLAVPEDSVAAEMYERVIARLSASGYAHYEVSSFARAGRRAVHNTLYWTSGEYLGLGSSASSFRRTPDGDGGGLRSTNLASVDRWLAAVESGGSAVELRDERTRDAVEREAVWLGLRLLDGLDLAAHTRLHGIDPLARHRDEIARLEREGLVEVTGDRLRLTRRGLLFADEVGARFV
jgi:oxygen-independent coproporphyrinogen-3 oxidase